MKKYKVVISKTAKEDMSSIYNFITVDCENEYGAVKVLQKIRNKCDSLSSFPKIKPIIMNYKDMDLRLIKAGKYTISYFVNDKKSEVVIYKVMSSKRNIAAKIIEE